MNRRSEGDGLLERDQIDTVALKIEVLLIDAVVAVDHLPGQFMVIAFESVKRAQELIQDVLRHRLDVAPQRIKRLAI